ncbi:MAG: hypothetical protein WCL23_04635 [Candidatus Moraniibacteriota bacterium]
MKDRILIIICAVSGVVMIGSIVGYFMTKGSAVAKPSTSVTKPVSGSGQTRTDTKPTIPETPVSVKPTTETAAPTQPAQPLQPTKHYDNAKYGFSFDIPKDAWFEENTDAWDVGPVFSVDVEHPKLKPESKDHPTGTTTMSKFGTLFSVSVCDRSLNRGKCLVNGKIDGLDFKQQSATTIGGLSAQKFDDRAYVVEGRRFDYEIILNPSLSNSLTPSDLRDMKQMFEDIVKTIRFN